MTYTEMKQKVLALIEEISPDSEHLTDDPDIAAKFDEVVNQVMYELARIKKIPKYAEVDVAKGDLLDYAALERVTENEIYQIMTVRGVGNEPKAGGTLFKILEDGVAELECYVYPTRITDKTDKSKYIFELSADALEIMPYGVAADLLKSDVSADYGQVYASRYETMLQRLDPRYQLPFISIEGGVTI